MKKIKKTAVIIACIMSLQAFSQYEPLLGQIMWVPYNFAPRGWAECNGQTLSIAQNQALFALLGTTYGGNGITTFMLPNLQGRTIMDDNTDNNVPSLGQQQGTRDVTLTISEMPTHSHVLTAVSTKGDSSTPRNNRFSDSGENDPEFSTTIANTTMKYNMLSPTGGSQPHNNMQPYTTLKCVIAIGGIFPSRN